jgi:hypothetical protein
MANVNLLESYKGRLAVSESVYARAHNGEKLSQNKKMVVAKLLDNQNRFLNEAFDNSVGTQKADMGLFKKFTLNLTTTAIPNLIAFDLVMVHPMTAMSGYVSYVEYVAGSTKGDVEKMGRDADGNYTGTVFNSPFGLGAVDPTYTSSKVVEAVTAGEDFAPAWTPVAGTVRFFVNGAWGEAMEAPAKVPASATKVAYEYDNVVIPQKDIPQVTARMRSIALEAKARRIAIYYSQMAQFQAKNDYGFDLGDQLAEKAVGQLSYEIDTEITQLLIDMAPEANDLVWSKTLPVGVSKQEHYAGFVEVLEMGAQKIYDATRRFRPNYILIASNLLPILAFVPGFKHANTSSINGPYLAGNVNGLSVYVTPNIEAGRFVIGVNGSDMQSSAAVYAPYMPCVPTQLLQFADGANSQGFSCLYDLKPLNPSLVVSGRVTA